MGGQQPGKQGKQGKPGQASICSTGSPRCRVVLSDVSLFLPVAGRGSRATSQCRAGHLVMEVKSELAIFAYLPACLPLIKKAGELASRLHAATHTTAPGQAGAIERKNVKPGVGPPNCTCSLGSPSPLAFLTFIYCVARDSFLPHTSPPPPTRESATEPLAWGYTHFPPLQPSTRDATTLSPPSHPTRDLRPLLHSSIDRRDGCSRAPCPLAAGPTRGIR